MELTNKQKEIISKIHDFVKKESRGFSDVDDIFATHILNVVNFAEQLSEKYKANTFVVIIAAYLHDIIYIQTKNHETHEIAGSEFAKEYLKQFDISNEEINLISLCILHHRGSRNNKKESIEEKIVACADAMDHIDRSLEMFYRTNEESDTLEKAMEFMRGKLQRSWNKIELDEARKLVKNKYEAAKVLFGF